MPNHVSQRVTLCGPTEVVNHFRRQHFTNGTEADCLEQIESLKKTLESDKELWRKGQAGGTIADNQKWRYDWLERIGGPESTGITLNIADQTARLERIRNNDLGDNFSLASFAPQPPFIFSGGLTGDREGQNNRNWYAHNKTRYGTKWDAYSCDIKQEVEDIGDGKSKFVFYYETAWSTPEPILDLIAQAYPDLKILVEYIDEGWNFWGIRTMHDFQVDDACYEYSEVKAGSVNAVKALWWLERELRGCGDEEAQEHWDEHPEIHADFPDPKLLGREQPFDFDVTQ